jgi:type II secretory pathway component GspD/PulD (secretin)
MVLVDVVILRTQETKTENKGINLLQGITGTLGGVAVEYDSTKSTHKFSSNPQFILAGLEYNLNIFNDGSSKSDIIARPSLLAIDGKRSTFYSGDILHVQLSSNNSDGSMVDIPIGINLSVKPQFLSDDMVQITVHAHRSFLETTSEKVGFTSFSQTAKTSVDATAVLKFDETLVLSGLTENVSNNNKSGIPFLQSLPLIQYLTSNKQELEIKNSILILLTPRKVEYVTGDMNQHLLKERIRKKQQEQRNYTKKLKQSVDIKVSNTDIALGDIAQRNPFYNQFRKGDLSLEPWENDDTILGSFIRILGFLYY